MINYTTTVYRGRTTTSETGMDNYHPLRLLTEHSTCLPIHIIAEQPWLKLTLLTDLPLVPALFDLIPGL